MLTQLIYTYAKQKYANETQKIDKKEIKKRGETRNKKNKFILYIGNVLQILLVLKRFLINDQMFYVKA